MNSNPPPGGGNVHGYHQHGVSLLSGWLPWSAQVLVVLLVVAAVG